MLCPGAIGGRFGGNGSRKTLIPKDFARVPKAINVLGEDHLSLVESISLLQKAKTSFMELLTTLKCVQEFSLILDDSVGLVEVRSLDTSELSHMKFEPI